MVAFMHCLVCSTGKCDTEKCQVGNTRKGTLGGWSCPCKHTDKERKQAKERVAAQMEKFFGGTRNKQGLEG